MGLFTKDKKTTGQVITEALGDRVVGGLIGVADGTIIENCSSNAVVINNSDEDKMCKLGGLIGDYSGPSMAKSVLIGDCNTNGKVINNSIKLSYSNLVLGGVIGQYLQGNNRYNVNNLYSESVIRSKSSGEIGGLIGFSAGNVDNCYTNVMIEIDSIGIGSLAAVGGLIGVCSDIRGSEPVIQNSYSSGNLIIKKEISTIYLGGLIGQSTVTNPSLNQGKMKTILKNSFSSINIDIIEHGSSSSYIGGIIGNGFSIQISNTYAFGKINTENLSSTASLVGIIGLKSNNYVYISRSYWCTETTGLSTSGINNSTVLGKTVDEMLDKDTFIGFDFNSIWTIDESGKSFPYLVSVKKPSQVLKENINYEGFKGEGTEENPILIENAEQLSKINLLTGKEYLQFVSELYNQKEKFDELLAIYIPKLKLENSLEQTISSYSLGMKQKIYLAGAFMSNAQNIILDEPFNAIDPESTSVIKKILFDLKDTGKMILFSVHNLDLVSNFCDRIIFIDNRHSIFECNNPQNFDVLEKIFFDKCVIKK